MIKCDYFKKSINKCKCKLSNSTITLLDCIKCTKFKQTSVSSINITPRSKSVLKRIKMPLNKISKKREFVIKETYDYVFNRDNGCCQLCNSTNNIALHHIIYRSHSKSGINNVDNCIILCREHHDLVHSNSKKYKPILQEIIANKKRELD